MIRWGIDLGGTKIEGVVLDTERNNQILAKKRIATEGEKGYQHVIGQIAHLVELLKEETKLVPKRIGIGTPGSIDPTTQLLKGSNSVHLNDKPILEDLKKVLNMEVAMANDANCFALAEVHMGIVQDVIPDAEVAFGIIMGTGVGGGLVVKGEIINGANGIAGEWGHNFLDETGGECYCGKSGCVEMIISGPALEKFYFELSGEKLKLEEIENRSTKDEHAKYTMDRLFKYYGIAVSSIINMIDPDVIIIGGGVGNIDSLYTEGFEWVKKHVFNPDCNTKILKPRLGDSAGVYGAAFL